MLQLLLTLFQILSQSMRASVSFIRGLCGSCQSMPTLHTPPRFLYTYLVGQFLNNHWNDYRRLWTDLMHRGQFLVEDIMYDFHGTVVSKRQWLCQGYEKGDTKAVKIGAMIRLKCRASSLLRRHVDEHLQEVVGSISLHRLSPPFRCQALLKASGSRSKIPDFHIVPLWP